MLTSEQVKQLHLTKNNSSTPEIQLLKRQDQSRKTANNILNAVRYIECVKYKCANRTDEHIRYVLDESEKANKRSRIWAIVFGVITVLSLVVTLFSMCPKKSSTQDSDRNDNKQTEVTTSIPQHS